MKILLIGGGGREHALAWKCARSPRRPRLFCAPGNAGTAALGSNLPLAAEDLGGLLAWARREKPDLTIVGPEAPLCAGLADRFQEAGLPVFGPGQAGARLEGSKVFAKSVLESAGVPTARARSFTRADEARAYVRAAGAPLVIKADGLASGKGVLLCRAPGEAEAAVAEAMERGAFGGAGRRILVEEYLEGEEVSVLALVDGRRAALLPSAQDHKRAYDGDRGPNTGGMGAYSPAPFETPEFQALVRDTVFAPTLRELARRGIDYRGVLYAGLMLTAGGPKVLEFNCRFGDPETQAILPRIRGDLIPLLEACIEGALPADAVACSPEACACVVMAAEGYPGSVRKGDAIAGLEQAGAREGVVVFHAGTKIEKGTPVTAGGRILGVTALGRDLAHSVARAYEAAADIAFSGAWFRRDIAAKGLRRAGGAATGA